MSLEIIGDILRITVLAGLGIAGILAVLIWKKSLTTRVTFLRFVIQAVAFAAIFLLFTYPVWLLIVLSVILIMTLFVGRFYCGWLCPFGLYMDVLILIRKAFKKSYLNLSDKLNKNLHNLRYVLLLLFLIILPVIWGLIEPPSSLETATFIALFLAGPFQPLNVLLGPIITIIVPWQGPLVLGSINFSYPYVQEIINYTSGYFESINFNPLPIVFVGLTVISSFYIRRVWCRFCPTGVSLAVVNRFKGFKWAPLLHLNKDETKCTKCGVCKRVCPLQVNDVYEQKGGKIDTSMCMLCARCVEMCPYEDTLKLKLGRQTLFKSRNWLEPSTIE
jgi:ferredoxin-type protein NapH